MEIKIWEQECCPVTGLAIKRLPDWEEKHFLPNYHNIFRIVGDNIILSVPVGMASLEGTHCYLKERELFIKQAGLWDSLHIEIRDYKYLEGSVTWAMRNAMTDYFIPEHARGKILSLINFNTSAVARMVTKALIKMLPSKYDLRLARDYEAAIKEALLVSAERCPELNRKNNEEKIDYCMQTETFSSQIRVVPKDILVTKSVGVFSESDIVPYFQMKAKILEKVFGKGGSYYAIMEHGDVKIASWKTAMQFLDYHLKLGRDYHCHALVTWVKQLLSLAKRPKIVVITGEILENYAETQLDILKEMQVKVLRKPYSKVDLMEALNENK